MQAGEITALVASIVSVLIGALAIWLSVTFYRMSSTLSESTKEAAKGIGSGVDRLEKLFDKLYADTFSMMKDTVSDMRKHIWPDQDGDAEGIEAVVEEKANAKIDTLRREVAAQLRSLLEKQSSADAKMEEMSALLDKAIDESRRVESEVRNEAIRAYLLECLEGHEYVIASDLLTMCTRRYPDEGRVFEKMLEELGHLKSEGKVAFDDEDLMPSTVVRLS